VDGGIDEFGRAEHGIDPLLHGGPVFVAEMSGLAADFVGGPGELLNEQAAFARFGFDGRHQVFDEHVQSTNLKLFADDSAAGFGVAAVEFAEHFGAEHGEPVGGVIGDPQGRQHMVEYGLIQVVLVRRVPGGDVDEHSAGAAGPEGGTVTAQECAGAIFELLAGLNFGDGEGFQEVLPCGAVVVEGVGGQVMGNSNHADADIGIIGGAEVQREVQKVAGLSVRLPVIGDLDGECFFGVNPGRELGVFVGVYRGEFSL